MEVDPFQSLLGLEDEYYSEGYRLGTADGTRAGLIEGRIFGLEKGFEKFVDMGRLYARSVIWASRLKRSLNDQDHQQSSSTSTEVKSVPIITTAAYSCEADSSVSSSPYQDPSLPSLPSNPRLEKQIRTLHALTEIKSLSTQNNEDAVSEFDDRFRRALGKAKIIEKLLGEDLEITASQSHEATGTGSTHTYVGNKTESNIEDSEILHARH